MRVKFDGAGEYLANFSFQSVIKSAFDFAENEQNECFFWSKMKATQRIAASLLCSVVLFAVFAVIAFAGLFNSIESRFYQPMVSRGIESRLQKVARAQEQYSNILFKRFETFASEPSVRTLSDSRPSDEQVKEREKKRSSLLIETRALKGIRLIDQNGINILYSSFSSDILSEQKGKTTFKKYSELVARFPSPEIAFPLIRASETGFTIFRDGVGNRLVFSVPFKNSEEKIIGTMAFYLDPSDLNRFLYDEKLIDVTGFGELLSDSAGFGGYVFALPNAGRTAAEKAVLEKWQMQTQENAVSFSLLDVELPQELEEIDAKKPSLVIYSIKNRLSGYSAWVYDATIFVFPDSVRFLLLLLAFITLFLIVFLFFSLKRDDMTIIRERIKKFHLSFVVESVNSSSLPPNVLEQKERINSEIKKSLGRRLKKHESEVDALLESSWDNIFSALGIQKKSAVDEANLRRILTEVLNGKIAENARAPVPPAPQIEQTNPATNVSEEVADAETVEEVADAETAEEIANVEVAEEIADAETVEEVADAETVEEVEDAEAAEEVADAESVEKVEDAESVEEIADAETVEEIAEAETVEEIAEAETVEEVEDAEAVEEIADAESAEEIADAETVEEVEDAEIAEEVEDAESVEEGEDAETVEEVAEAETVEEVEDAETVEEVAEAETVEEVAEAETAEEIAEAETVEEVEDAESVEEVAEAETVEEVEDSETVEEIADAETEAGWLSAEDFPEDDEVTEPSEVFDDDAQTEKSAPPQTEQREEQARDGSFFETLKFSSPETSAPVNAKDSWIASNFSASSPDFGFLDTGDLEKINTDELLDFAAEEPEVLEKPFLFAPFGSDSVSELESLD